MKKLAHIRKLLIAAVVIFVALAGFWIGRVSAPEGAGPGRTPGGNHPAPVEVAAPGIHAPHPAPAPTDSPAPTPPASAEILPASGTYVLKKDGNGLVVLKNEVVVAAFSANGPSFRNRSKPSSKRGSCLKVWTISKVI